MTIDEAMEVFKHACGGVMQRESGSFLQIEQGDIRSIAAEISRLRRLAKAQGDRVAACEKVIEALEAELLSYQQSEGTE